MSHYHIQSCLICKEIHNNAIYLLCHHCENQLVQHKSSVQKITEVKQRVFYRYTFPLNHWLIQYKFQRHYYFAKLFAQLFSKNLLQYKKPSIDIICPIPSHPLRVTLHGFDHCKLLTKQISKEVNIPYRNLLVRHKHAKPLSGLKAEKRHQYIKNSYTCIKNVADLKIAMIDDIYTTGSTSNEAYRTLKLAGAMHVEIWTIAKSTIKNN